MKRRRRRNNKTTALCTWHWFFFTLTFTFERASFFFGANFRINERDDVREKTRDDHRSIFRDVGSYVDNSSDRTNVCLFMWTSLLQERYSWKYTLRSFIRWTGLQFKRIGPSTEQSFRNCATCIENQYWQYETE